MENKTVGLAVKNSGFTFAPRAIGATSLVNFEEIKIVGVDSGLLRVLTWSIVWELSVKAIFMDNIFCLHCGKFS